MYGLRGGQVMHARSYPCCACCWSPTNLDGVDPDLHADGARDMHDLPCTACERDAWREPLGALRLTLSGNPATVDVARAQVECEQLVMVLNGIEP